MLMLRTPFYCHSVLLSHFFIVPTWVQLTDEMVKVQKQLDEMYNNIYMLIVHNT